MKLRSEDLVAKALADLSDTEWRFLRAVVTTLSKSTKMPCAVSGADVALLGLDGSEVGSEHHVELAWQRPLAGFAGFRQSNVGQPAVSGRMPVFGFVVPDEMVGPVALMCDQRLISAGQRKIST